MEFNRIISRSFELAWQHKFLWLFGMFAGGSGFYLDFSVLFDLDENPEEIFNQLDMLPETLIPFLMGILIWGLIMFVLKLISEVAVIDSINRIERGGLYSFASGYSAGLDFFFRYLGLAIMKGLVIIASVGLIGFIMFILFAITPVLGIMFLLLFIPGFLFVIFVITNIFTLAERGMIVRNSGIIESIEEGYYLFKNRFSDNFIIFLIFVGMSIAFGIGSFILWMFFGIPIGIIIALMNMEPMTAFVMSFIIGLPISLVIGGIFGVFFSNLYTLFYFELVEPKKKREIPPAQIYGNNNPPELV